MPLKFDHIFQRLFNPEKTLLSSATPLKVLSELVFRNLGKLLFRVNPSFSLSQYFRGDIGGHNFYIERIDLFKILREPQSQGIGLLPAGTSRAPQSQPFGKQCLLRRKHFFL
jgi:hypothetical protein